MGGMSFAPPQDPHAPTQVFHRLNPDGTTAAFPHVTVPGNGTAHVTDLVSMTLRGYDFNSATGRFDQAMDRVDTAKLTPIAMPFPPTAENRAVHANLSGRDHLFYRDGDAQKAKKGKLKPRFYEAVSPRSQTRSAHSLRDAEAPAELLSFMGARAGGGASSGDGAGRAGGATHGEGARSTDSKGARR